MLFNFEREGVILAGCSADKEEEVFEVAAENGGMTSFRGRTAAGVRGDHEVAGFMECQRALAGAGFARNPDGTALKMIPLAEVEVR